MGENKVKIFKLANMGKNKCATQGLPKRSSIPVLLFPKQA